MVDVSALVAPAGDRASVALELAEACRRNGFFYAVGHGVDEALQAELFELGRRFFACDLERKLEIRMARGGRAWRGYFPVGAELTSGRPDGKEGLYFGAEHPPDHPRVLARTPLHGPNLFPDIPGFREAVLAYIEALTRLGHALVKGLSLALGLASDYFARRYTADPLVLFRIFHYPPLAEVEAEWSVAEHTDYGLLTLLLQDDVGGLEVRCRNGWVAAPPLPGSFVCNLGDMLDRMTGGLYRSTPHRVRNLSRRGRLSCPFFFDPGFDARIEPIAVGAEDAHERWDGESLRAFEGSYGEYLLRKVGRVFPELGGEHL